MTGKKNLAKVSGMDVQLQLHASFELWRNPRLMLERLPIFNLSHFYYCTILQKCSHESSVWRLKSHFKSEDVQWGSIHYSVGSVIIWTTNEFKRDFYYYFTLYNIISDHPICCRKSHANPGDVLVSLKSGWAKYWITSPPLHFQMACGGVKNTPILRCYKISGSLGVTYFTNLQVIGQHMSKVLIRVAITG